jgi:hypothetical protein
MAVGTGNITLQDVTTEIYGDTNVGRNLVSCFADATGIFDSTYVGAKDRLSNFKGYNNTRADFDMGETAYGSGASACFPSPAPTASTHSHNGNGTYPAIGDVIYDASDAIVVGGNSWYWLTVGEFSIRIDNFGSVTSEYYC